MLKLGFFWENVTSYVTLFSIFSQRACENSFIFNTPREEEGSLGEREGKIFLVLSEFSRELFLLCVMNTTSSKD